MHTRKEPKGFTTRLVGITASIGWWHESMYLVIHLLGHSWWYCMSLFFSCYPYRKGQMVQMLWESDCFPWLANASDITAVHALQVKWNWSSFQLNCLHNWTWTASANMYVHDSYVCIYGRDCNSVSFHHPASIWPFGLNWKFQKPVRHSSNVSWQIGLRISSLHSVVQKVQAHVLRSPYRARGPRTAS